MRLRRGGLALALVAGLAVSGCDGLPSSGPIHIEQIAVPQGQGASGQFVDKLAQLPQPGESPDAVVSGFLEAEGDSTDGYTVARDYLAPTAHVDLGGAVSVYLDGSVQLAEQRAGANSVTVTASSSRLGRLDAQGEFLADPGQMRQVYRLQRLSGQWRLVSVPPGVQITNDDLDYSYRALDLYYPSQSGAALVPEQVYLPAAPLSLPTALVRSLLGGPDSLLAPEVTTPLGPQVPLDAPADLVGGVVTVDLGVPATAIDAATVQQLLVQLAATLGQLGSVTGQPVTSVRLTAEGTPVVTGNGRLATLATAAVDAELVDSRSGGARASGGVPAHTTARAASSDGQQAAVAGGIVVVRQGRGRWHLVGVPGPVNGVAYGPGGVLWIAGPEGLETLTGGHRHVIGGPPALSVAVAPDGVRVAIGTAQGVSLLGVGLSGQLSRPRPLAPSLSDVTALSWDGTDSLAVLARSGSGPVQLFQVDDDASLAPAAVEDQPPLPSAPTWLAAAPDKPVLLATPGEVWAEENQLEGGWQLVGRGVLPAYAQNAT